MARFFKRFVSVVLFFFFLIIFNVEEIQATETINSFYSIIEINQDTTLSITEQIQFTTDIRKHGIYRYIPVRYNKDGVVEVLPISQISVTDDQGNKIPFTRSSDGNFVTLKIGDPDTTFLGEKNYVISYTVERGINQFEEYNELYWDITGEGWQIPIQQSSASVVSNYAPILQVECYSGPVGGDDGLCNFESGEHQATFTYLNEISYGDNITVVLSFPKDSELIFPSQTDLLLFWIKNNWPILLTPFPLIVMFFWWYKKGRDHVFISQDIFDLNEKPSQLRPVFSRARVPMVYEPLKDLSPGESGSLLDDKVDIQDVISEILELARKKYLKISVKEKKGLFLTSRDYEFVKMLDGKADLSKVQKYLLDQIFKLGDIVKLTKLKGTFYTSVAHAKTLLENELVLKSVYTSKPTTRKVTGFIFYSSMLAAVVGIFSMTIFNLGLYWPLVLLLLQSPIGFWISMNLPQKTAVGNNLWLQARGLQASIKRGAWREKIKEKNLFIEEVLPFAVSLGVVKQLAKDMDDLQIKPPEYISTMGMTSWTMTDFVSGFSQEVGSSLSYNPSSSSSSGGSGFSGGSSGGGGGGGGGGSW